MLPTPFIWLGSRRTRRWGIGGEAALLDAAAAAGLPVPPAALLCHEFYQLLLQENLVLIDGRRLTLPDPGALSQMLYGVVRFPRFDRSVVVRHAFTGQPQPPAGGFPSPAGRSVDFTAPDQLAASLQAVYQAALSWETSTGLEPDTFRRDLLVMERVHPLLAGAAVAEPGSQTDLIQFNQEYALDSLDLPRLRPWRRPDPSLSPQLQRLQRLLRGLRRSFKNLGWSFNWSDDGRICWLTGIQPLPSSTPRR